MNRETMRNQFQEQIDLINILLDNPNFESKVNQVIEIISKTLNQGLPLLVCGNGGSASDAMHISGELVGKFHLERRALNVICLNSNTTVLTAWANDKSYDSVFERQVDAHGKPGGVCWGLSTSGNSKSIILAFEKAKTLRMTTIGFTGLGGGKLANFTDILVDVPSNKTPRVQELHVSLYHFICEKIEANLAKSDSL